MRSPLLRKPQRQSPHDFPPPTSEGPVSFHTGEQGQRHVSRHQPDATTSRDLIVGIAMKPDLTGFPFRFPKVSLHAVSPPPGRLIPLKDIFERRLHCSTLSYKNRVSVQRNFPSDCCPRLENLC